MCTGSEFTIKSTSKAKDTLCAISRGWRKRRKRRKKRRRIGREGDNFLKALSSTRDLERIPTAKDILPLETDDPSPVKLPGPVFVEATESPTDLKNVGRVQRPQGPRQNQPGDNRQFHFSAALLCFRQLPAGFLTDYHNPTVCRQPH